MTIPQSLAKQIKAKCTDTGQYFLAQRVKLTVTQVGRGFDGNNTIPINITDVSGSFTWQDANRVAYTAKPVITTEIVDTDEILEDIDQFSPSTGFLRRSFKRQIRKSKSVYANGDIVAVSSTAIDHTIDIQSTTSSSGFTSYQANSDITVTRIEQIDYYLVSCRCKDGDDIDCKAAPNGFCCIPYTLIDSLCAKLTP